MSLIISRFDGTEPFYFYNNTVELRYHKVDHIYYLREEQNLIPLDGVTTVVHIIDKSFALMPWACKMMAERLKLTLPQTVTQYASSGDLTVFDKWIDSAKSAHTDKKEDAAEVGRLAHDWLERLIKSMLESKSEKTEEILANFPADERAANCDVAALDWMHQHNVRWIATERKVFSKLYRYAGTMDGLALVDSCDNPLCCPSKYTDHLSLIDWKSSNHLYIEYLFQTAAYKAAYEEEFPEQKIIDRWILRLGKEDGEFDPWYLGPETFEIDLYGFLTCQRLYQTVDKVQRRMDEWKGYVKAALKVQRDAEKAAQAKIKCPKADKYKGIKGPPKCNGTDEPCETCLKKFLTNHPEGGKLIETGETV